MNNLILVRHGQSEWNVQNKFTGWVDVDLAPHGKLEACKAGEQIKELNINFNYFFTSFQKRAINTLKLILNTLRIKDKEVIKSWQFNERHYGFLTGLNKDDMKKKFGEDMIFKFRRSWDYPPEALDKRNPYHPINISSYDEVPRKLLPDTESLKDTYNRVIPFFKKNVEILDGNILISAHGNSLRSMCKYLFNIDKNEIPKLEIPTGNPLLIKFKDKKVISANYLDKDRGKDLLVF